MADSSIADDYFVRHLSLSAADARNLHARYYKDYGLAISGLVKHHKIEPLAYNREVDDALPLDDIIKPNPKLRRLLLDFDRSKIKLWLFTNAYITHAKRVVSLLGVDECFEGITYCDYGRVPFLAKPHTEMFEKAEREAGLTQASSNGNCYFVDDSLLNCQHAKERGWIVVHKLEKENPLLEELGGLHQVKDLEDLRALFPHLFVQGSEGRRKEVNGASSQL